MSATRTIVCRYLMGTVLEGLARGLGRGYGAVHTSIPQVTP